MDRLSSCSKEVPQSRRHRIVDVVQCQTTLNKLCWSWRSHGAKGQCNGSPGGMFGGIVGRQTSLDSRQWSSTATIEVPSLAQLHCHDLRSHPGMAAPLSAWSFQRLSKDLVDLVEEGEDLLSRLACRSNCEGINKHLQQLARTSASSIHATSKLNWTFCSDVLGMALISSPGSCLKSSQSSSFSCS